ncbi:MAG: hypothetical protein D6741_16555, partial [Planctomycetota bacterium]
MTSATEDELMGSTLLQDTFTLRIHMLSDWHVGTGMGRPGSVDRLVARDEDECPFIPAKTIRGVWRDACECVARGLDEGKPGPWSRFVDFLFGSQPGLGSHDPTGRHADPAAKPLESSVLIRAARLPVKLRKLVCKDPRLLDALTFVKPGVSLDPRTGRAKDQCLRFEEMARASTVLESKCRLRPIADEQLRKTAVALLAAGAAMVERLGGKRRRGAGRCRFELVNIDRGEAIQWLREHQTPPAWDERSALETVCFETTSAEPEGWIVVPLTLRLRSPLAVTGRTLGNVVETLDFLPGTYLLPHISKILRSLKVDPYP